MPALGERFRAAREARGLTLSEVSEQLRIRALYLGAIEEEHWSTIGAPVYARGFLRTYARFLGLDPEEAVAAFNASSGTAAAPRTPEQVEDDAVPLPGRRANLTPFIWIASLVAVALIAFVVYNEMTLPKPGAQAVVTASSEVPPTALPSNVAGVAADAGTGAASPGATASPSPSPSAASAAPNTLELRLSAPSWLRVSVDGGASIEGTFPAGTVKTFHGTVAIVRVGNAGGVEAVVDGRSIGVLGKTGDVVDRTFTL